MSGFNGDIALVSFPQCRKERVGDGYAEIEARRQLHQNASKPFAESRSLDEERTQVRIYPDKAILVRDCFRHLHRKTEILGYARRPSRVSRPKMGAVERGIDFGCRKHAGVTSEMGAISRKMATKCDRQRPSRRSHAYLLHIRLVVHTQIVAATRWPAAYRMA